jgi:hypothetical protein
MGSYGYLLPVWWDENQAVRLQQVWGGGGTADRLALYCCSHTDFALRCNLHDIRKVCVLEWGQSEVWGKVDSPKCPMHDFQTSFTQVWLGHKTAMSGFGVGGEHKRLNLKHCVQGITFKCFLCLHSSTYIHFHLQKIESIAVQSWRKTSSGVPSAFTYIWKKKGQSLKTCLWGHFLKRQSCFNCRVNM